MFNTNRSTLTHYMDKNNIPRRTISEDNKRRYFYMSEEDIRNQTKQTRTKESRHKISIANKGKKFPNRIGKNSPCWNPNKTDEERMIGRAYPEYYEWRQLVFERDEFTCQCCFEKGLLNAHHIESYSNNPELRTIIENGITLCETCHKDFHHNFGYGNNTKKQLYVFLLEHKKEKQNG